MIFTCGEICSVLLFRLPFSMVAYVSGPKDNAFLVTLVSANVALLHDGVHIPYSCFY